MRLFLHLLSLTPPAWIQTATGFRGRYAWFKAITDWLPAMLRNQDGPIQKGLGRGLHFNGSNSAVGFLLGIHDLEVQYVFFRLLRPGMTVYDIGANVGFTALLAAKQVSPAGQVICFEPLAGNADQILHNAALNGFHFIRVHRIAVGGFDAEAEFQVSQSPTWGRLARAGPTPLENGVIRVPVRSLDSLSASERLPLPQLIKIDVEGAEAEVISGGKTLLANARPVLVIEVHKTLDAVLEALNGLEYTVRPLTPTGKFPPMNGEFQVLAAPRERRDIEPALADLASGQMAFQ